MPNLFIIPPFIIYRVINELKIIMKIFFEYNDHGLLGLDINKNIT